MKRRNPGWVPNQHGAWAMLASPLLVGMIAGGVVWIDLPLAAFWFTGYFAFFATSLWLKSHRQPRFWPPVRTYVPLAAALGLLVAVADPSLLRWAPGFVAPLGLGLWAASVRRERDLVAGLTLAVGSCLMTLVAYDAGSGGVDRMAWELAAVQAMYFAGTVFYVKSAIRERNNTRFLRISVACHAACVPAALWLGCPLGVVFTLLTVRATLIPPLGWSPKRIGIIEAVATVVVSVVSLVVL